MKMTVEEKKQFVKDVLKEVRENILEKVNKMPDRWEGIELRLYIQDAVKEYLELRYDPKIVKQYKNDKFVLNL